jgi:hypothetical protein
MKTWTTWLDNVRISEKGRGSEISKQKGKTKNGSVDYKGGKIRTWLTKIMKMRRGYKLG